MGEHERELVAQGALLVTADAGFTATRQAVARTRRAPQVVLGLLFLLGLVGLLSWGRAALPPFLLGLIVAYMLLAPVRRVERAVPPGGLWQRVRRLVTAIAVFLCTLLVMGYLLPSLTQPVIAQTAQVLGNLDELGRFANANAPGIRDWYVLNVPEIARGWINDGLQTLGQTMLSLGSSVGGGIVSYTSNALSSVVAIIAVPLLVICFLIDEPKLTRRIRNQFSHAWVGDALALFHIFNRVLRSYTRGVIVASIIVAIIAGLGYYLIGIQVWLPLGVIALVGEIVPIIGPWIAFFISLPVILATQPDKAILVVGFFVVIQILEGLFLAPRIQGRSVNFTPSAALVALAVEGVIGGPLGVILSLPAAALMRDVAFYTAYRVGGFSPAGAMTQLPSLARHKEAKERRGVLLRSRRYQPGHGVTA